MMMKKNARTFGLQLRFQIRICFGLLMILVSLHEVDAQPAMNGNLNLNMI